MTPEIEKTSVVGIGRLGLCFSLTLESCGYDVVGCDINEAYVKKINNKTFISYEPGLNEHLSSAENFSATIDIRETVQHSDLLFVTVATFSEKDGEYDVSQVDSVVESLYNLGPQKIRKHLVICSNVNPGYSDTVFKKLRDLNWDVSYNPETVAQGTILKNQAEPDCVYVGSDNLELAEQIKKIYTNMCTNEPKIHIMDRLSAELTKVSLNCFLTCKISFANMVGDLAIKLGADPNKVLYAVGSDSRINNKFFKYGFGWGGPCFPRDTRAFARLAKNNDMCRDLCESSILTNDKHLEFQVYEFIKSGKGEYYTDSITYKKGTVILEESQQLKFAIELAKKGIRVIIKESEAVTQELKRKYGDMFVYE